MIQVSKVNDEGFKMLLGAICCQEEFNSRYLGVYDEVSMSINFQVLSRYTAFFASAQIDEERKDEDQ